MFNLFKRKAMTPVTPTFTITEGVLGYFHYHISTYETLPYRVVHGLCGAKTMHTSIPLNSWGVKDHLPSKWCKTCEELVEDAR